MAETSVLETLTESKGGLRKCWFAPKTLAPGAKTQKPSGPFLLRGSGNVRPPLSLLRPVVVSSSARQTCSSLLGLTRGHMVLCRIVVT